MEAKANLDAGKVNEILLMSQKIKFPCSCMINKQNSNSKKSDSENLSNS